MGWNLDTETPKEESNGGEDNGAEKGTGAETKKIDHGRPHERMRPMRAL
jgi:hypothetical protein